ncbi:F0F1 ATP synthase subunit gamma [Thioclava pacifica]|uniref:ATPase n=1 Tax=Thioclava pacifica DSM 10166 TaxID=1353537 RepID=A0A074J5I3_9RHOB|nr:FoF1 ATP synthase subunit gamma [Thioclava pacifica]KEO50883.1 hypothetical protein TP2_13425 [Thioclava pacifica DSM 10166]
MSGRAAELRERIETVHKLETVISAMRGIAASRVQEAHQHLESIRTFAATIGAAISEVLVGLDLQGGSIDPPREERSLLLLFAAEQGFAGSFSEKLFDVAQAQLVDGGELFLVGDRGLLVAAERGLHVDWSVPMIAHPMQAAGLATRITDAIFARIAGAGITRVTLVHASPDGAEPVRVETKALMPFDFTRFPPPKTRIAPLMTLPPEHLLQSLIEEHVFAEISEAVILSFAAENEARMRAMIAAQENTSDTLDEMVRGARRLRQEEITEEIVELATASLTQS